MDQCRRADLQDAAHCEDLPTRRNIHNAEESIRRNADSREDNDGEKQDGPVDLADKVSEPDDSW